MEESKNNQQNKDKSNNSGGQSQNASIGGTSVTGSSPVSDHSSPDGDSDSDSPRNQESQSNDLRSGKANNENKDMGQP
jgi:hypothetical protein